MSTPSRIVLAFILIAAGIAAFPGTAHASPTGYESSKVRWNGLLRVVDGVTGDGLDSAYVITRNVPTSWRSMAFRILMGDGGRAYGQADSAGFAFTQVKPLGSVTVWKPGYWPEKLEWNIIGGDTGVALSETGVLTFALRRAGAAERPAAAMDLLGKLEATVSLARKWIGWPLMNPNRAILANELAKALPELLESSDR